MDSTNTDRDALEKQLVDPNTPPIYLPLEFLKDITNEFCREQELGRGGYGVVYKGVLRSGKIIAVKKLFDIHLVDDDQFQKEVTNLMGTKQKNVVQLVGYCADSRWEPMKLPNGTFAMVEVPTRLLCFEYLPNKSLDKHISDETSGLDWNKRFQIMKEICNGLHFLHRECHIIHLDLKPENILMDDTFIPKIADFGLSRLLGGHKSRTVINGNIAGSCGYMAPEYFLQGVVSPMADIFSFGVIMIEIITGCRGYPLSTIPFLLQLNENRGQSSDMSLQRYQEQVIGRWRNVFQKEEKCTSPEIYIQQVKRCITIALRCVDHDSTRRPSICDIVQMLNAVERKDSEHNIYQICCASQKRDLISTQPIELSFRTNEEESLSSCMLELDNNINHRVAFRILTENVKTINLLWQPCGIILPRSRYGVHVKVGKEIASENIILESTIVGDQSLPLPNTTEAISQYNDFFTDASKEGREVQQVKLKAVSVDEPRNMIVELEYPAGMISMVVHPTETWILSCHENALVQIWDYCAQETVKSSNLPLVNLCAATFIVRKEWLLVTDYIGNIRVYNYMTLEEIKMFNADSTRIEHFDIHPTEPYMLSASPSGRIKLWDWEKNWECIDSNNLTQRVYYVKFHLRDPSYYCSTSWSGVQIWNTNHSLPVFTFQLWGVNRIDFFTRDDHLHIIIAKDRDGPPEVWDCLNRTCVEKLEGHGDIVGVVCAHPELPILMTGSNDGTIRLWNSFDFRCEGILHCGLGKVLNITCLIGSKRIVVGLEKGVARLTLPELKSQLVDHMRKPY